MNIIDYVIIAVLAYFVLRGFYDGFLITILSTAAFFISWLSSILLSPLVAKTILANASFTNVLLYYTEGAEMITNIEAAKMPISQLSLTTLSEIITTSSLPFPIGRLIEKNIVGEVFASSQLQTVGEYFNQTIVHFTINIISFFIVFLIIRILITIGIRCANAASPFMVLSHFDRTFGSVFGFLRGVFFLFLVFMIIPLLFIVFNSLPITVEFEQSFLAKFFYKSNFLLTLIKGT